MLKKLKFIENYLRKVYMCCITKLSFELTNLDTCLNTIINHIFQKKISIYPYDFFEGKVTKT